MSSGTPADGWIDLEDGTGRVRYWRHGQGDETLLVLHGGPGAGHRYLASLAELADAELSVVLYDQLGSGESTRPDDPELWTMDRSVRETETVRRELDLGPVHLLGQSFGGFVALEYALAHPESVRSLILSNTAASAAETVRHMHSLRGELPPMRYRTLIAHEAAGTTDDPAYQDVVGELYARHLRRSHPYEPERSRAEYGALVAPLLADLGPPYEAMWGSNEFLCTGTLISWDVTDRLGDVAAPTLILCGLHDELGVPLHQTLAAGIPDNQFVIFGNSSHLPFLERDRAAYIDVVRGFIERRRSESPGERPQPRSDPHQA